MAIYIADANTQIKYRLFGNNNALMLSSRFNTDKGLIGTILNIAQKEVETETDYFDFEMNLDHENK